jgi:hypothetical protein
VVAEGKDFKGALRGKDGDEDPVEVHESVLPDLPEGNPKSYPISKSNYTKA